MAQRVKSYLTQLLLGDVCFASLCSIGFFPCAHNYRPPPALHWCSLCLCIFLRGIMTPLEFLLRSGLQSGSLLESLLSLEILYARQQGYHMPTQRMCRTLTFAEAWALGGPLWACVACALPTSGQDDDEEDDGEFGLDLQVALYLSRGQDYSVDLERDEE